MEGWGNRLINGLSPLTIDKNDFALWHFIVVNPLYKRDIDALMAEIQNIDYKKRKLTIGDLYNPEILVAVRKDLQTAYDKVFKGGNEYSMCMLSELADRSRCRASSACNENSWRCVNCWGIDGCGAYAIDGGLYCGDADFLHCDTLNCLKRRLGGRESHVGLLQLPHHGSKENFNVDLLNWLDHLQVSFACYGSPNRYNHPSSVVMGTAGCYSHVVGVDQCKSHVLTERIDVVKVRK